MGPEFNKFYDQYFKDKPDKPVMFGSIVAGAYADHALLPPGKYITMYVFVPLVLKMRDLWFSNSFLNDVIGSSIWSTRLAVARFVR